MSDIVRIRKSLSQAASSIKQGKAVAAVLAAQDGVNLLLGSQLMKAERLEFVKLIEDALVVISGDPLVRSLFPLKLELITGQERELLANIKDLHASLAEHVKNEAEQALKQRDERKKATLEKGLAMLSSDPTKALGIFASLTREFPRDAQLFGDIGEALLKAQLYEEAVRYLTDALDMKPDMLPFYNVIGIALRKLERFDTAETYYLRASTYLRNDPNLYFNIGRLYIDWKRWKKAKAAALVALKLNPDFEEAKKLLLYVEKFLTDKS